MAESLWTRLFGKRGKSADDREAEKKQMSAEEREFVDEPIEDHQADLAVESRLGGIDPNRLLED